MQTDADASGGLGSFSGSLLGALTGGLQQISAPLLSKAFGLNDIRYDVGADGRLVPASAPTPAANPPGISDRTIIVVGLSLGLLLGAYLIFRE